jgi:hypothetical protein
MISELLHEFNTSTILLYPPPPPIWEIVSTGVFFLFTFMCTQHSHHIYSLYPFLTCSPLLLVSTPPSALFHPPVLQFWKGKEKKWCFCLFKLATQGIYMWHFLSFGCINQFKNYIFILYRENINNITLTSFFYPPPSVLWPSLDFSCFSQYCYILLELYSTFEREHVAFVLLNLTNFT